MNQLRASSREDLMSVLGHELRSPLTAIRGAASLLLVAHSELAPAKVTELLRVIDSQAARMADRVEDVLVASRLDAGQQRVLVGDLELSDLIADNLESARAIADGRRIRVSGRVEGLHARGDLQRVSQVLRILLENAIRHSPPGSPVEVRVDARPKRVRIEVRDRGPGIAPDDRGRVFARGVKLDPGGPGAGLGLYIVRGLASAMDGEAGVDPRAGGGSTFWLSLQTPRK